jgi:hypothetical protein
VAGNVITPADVFQWAADNTSAVTLQPAADGLTCMAAYAGIGNANVTVTDPAAGIASAPFEVTTTAGAPAEIDVTAGEPTQIPPSSAS